MKYIDMRQQWIQQLGNKDKINYMKVLLTDNGAGYFTSTSKSRKD